MIAEFFRAAFLAGIPVGLTSFVLIWWAIRSDYLENTSSFGEMEKGVSALSKAQKKKKKEEGAVPRKLNPIHNKWMKFGGGFYGVVALITFVAVEADEVMDFIGNIADRVGDFSNLGLDLIIDFFINSLMNFITAITWPVYWMSRIESSHIWVWFVAAYGGYWLGAKMALHIHNKGEPLN